ncbi:MAG: type II toxin-antitoxin system VapC family toxin [Sphingopyxis sp.]|uniref:type II toxin-antitoxin system VapC family toxin n=1 Tax=Sphingopyxis TaxID=165697 RepID=UPI00144617E4|nr:MULTISPECIES: type II toxin-antitoxin system VapC family toxin [Sphingopyxis]MBL9067908.1 type II toxin-antitoxin system VapC family toxin [Sphingopyxis sp.]
MKYLLDSNAIIALVMNLDARLVSRAGECDEGDLVTSAIAYAEVAHGSTRGKSPAFDQLQAFVEEVRVLDFDYKAALAYAALPFRRGSYDRLIAAHALSHDIILVTANEADFTDVPGLRVENWTLP